MRRTNIYLEDRQTEALDRMAAMEGTSRADLIRRLLDRAIEGSDRGLEVDLQVIDDSFGAIVELDLPDRSPDGRDEHLRRMWGHSA